MNMFQYALVIFTILLNLFELNETCSLDDMKLWASEACEMLFKDPIIKRHSPLKKNYDDHYYSGSKRFKHFTTKCHVKGFRKAIEKHSIQICKEDYPKFGYLLLDKKYSKMKISNYDFENDNSIHESDPTLEYYSKYDALGSSKGSSGVGGGLLHKHLYRDKREFEKNKSITYCCKNVCRSDVFCK